MISAQHLTKHFGSFTAVADVSFEVARGEIVGFLGPNGAGKTTTMRILTGVFPPSAGCARIAGHDVISESLRARAAVGYLPERPALYTDMSVATYLRHVARMKRLERSAARRGVDDALAACALERVADRLIGTLSKGFRQRIGIAQALLGPPAALVLDEPTAGLDPEQVADVRTLIRGLRGERAVLLSTHVLSEAQAICDRVVIMHRGRVRAVDTPANLDRRLRRAAQVYLEINGPEAEVIAALRAVPGVASALPQTGPGPVRVVVSAADDADLREALAAAVSRGGWGLRELRPVALSLEDIFLSLIAGAPASPSDREP